MTDAVSAARAQFAFTIMFHYLFPILTMGLGVLIAVLKTLASVFSGLFPRLLPALDVTVHPGLDIYNAAAPANSMRVALGIYVFGMAIVVSYLIRIYRVWRGKVTAASYHP